MCEVFVVDQVLQADAMLLQEVCEEVLVVLLLHLNEEPL